MNHNREGISVEKYPINKQRTDKQPISRDSVKEHAGQSRADLAVLAASLLALIPFAARLFRYSISIDTEEMINAPQKMLTSWLYHERVGLVISKYLFGQTSFHYTVELVGTVLFLAAACLVWNRAVHRAAEGGWDWLFPLLFLTHPVVTEQLHFILQSMEVAWAVLLCLAAAGWLDDGCYEIWQRGQIPGKRSGWKIPAGILALIWSFSSYQSLVPLYIAAAAGLYLIRMERMRERYWAVALSQVGVFLIAFLLSRGAAKIGLYRATGSFEATAYVAGMVQWGTKPVIDCIRELYHYGVAILLGQGPYYTAAYLIALAGTVLVWLAGVFRSRSYLRITYVLAGVILYLTPFLLPLYLGGADQKRAQMTLAFVIAFGWWYLIRLIGRVALERKKCVSAGGEPVLDGQGCAPAGKTVRLGSVGLILAGVCAVLLAGLQWKQSWRLNQTAYKVYRQELALTEAVCEAIEETGAPPDAKVQIVGRWSPVMTEDMVAGETISWSFYEWDAEQAYGSTGRVIGLWNTLGYRYQAVDLAAAPDGVAAAAAMPVWPEEGAVRWDGSTVIVRIGE